MKRLVDQRYLMRRNIIAVVGFCLFTYFAYNLFCGQRSVFRLYALNREIADASATYDRAHQDRMALETQVVRLRPATLDRDFLEERARVVLGFGYAGERIIITAARPATGPARLN